MIQEKSERDERVKALESVESGRRFPRESIIMIRLDGRGFSRWTGDLERPYDKGLGNLMAETARLFMQECGARYVFTQSDEITVVLSPSGPESMTWFDGRVQKLVSSSAAFVTGAFNQLLPRYLPGKPVSPSNFPTFDSRVWTVPTEDEAVEAVLTRVLDCRRNSIQTAAHARFPHTMTERKSALELREMLRAAGHPWEFLPDQHKFGTQFYRTRVTRPYTADEIEKLPPKHAARKNPDLTVERTEIVELEFTPTQVPNFKDVIFRGERP